MYYQTSDPDKFVLNPRFENDIGSYDARDGSVMALVTNKKDISKFLDQCFTDYDFTYEGKVGSYNKYIVLVFGPLKEYDALCVTTRDPDPFGTVVFSMELPLEEVTSKTRRSPLLNHWVLQGAHPTQFNKLLKRDFDVVEVQGGVVRLTRKIPNVESDPSHNV